MSRWLNRFQPWGVLVLRLVLGIAMVVHGYPKVIPSGAFRSSQTFAALNRFAHYVGTLGLPYWLGYVAAFAEFVGGICLLLGLFTRFFAFLVTIEMLVAIAVVTRHHGYSGSEYPLALTAIAFMLLLSGPGKAAVDRRMGFS
ncbi:MAG TPA: DoxX family protein [Acidobacteriaceae bacterium]